MAFVYKSENKPSEKLTFENLGPGKYVTHTPYKFKENSVGFLSKSEKLTKLKLEKPNETYQIDLSLTSNFAHSQNQIHWLETSQNQNKKTSNNKFKNSVFKSSTKRFDPQQKVENFPGPGAYTPEFHEKLEQKRKENYEKNKFIDEILLKRNYQPIPSIPSNNINYLGYSELDLEKNVFQSIQPNSNDYITKETIQGKVGPGSYETKNFFELRRNKGYSWGKKPTSHDHLRKKNENNNLGPGSYDIQYDIKPLYQYKQSGSFSSTMTRNFLDQKPSGERAKKLFLQRMKKNMQNASQISFAEQTTLDMNLSNNIYETKETYLGPGTYYNEKLASSIKIQTKPLELQNFGSSSIRFNQKEDINKMLGPGKYDLKQNKDNNRMAPIVQVPFMSSNERFENKETFGIPGPGTYNPKLKISIKNPQSKMLATKANFGVNSERFKIDDENKPGPGTYIDPLQLKKKISGNNFYFKSQSERDMFEANNMNPGSGTYNVTNHMIEKNVKTYKEQDPDVLMKKPPFNIQQERFTPLLKESQNNDLNLEIEEKNPQIHSKDLGAKFLKKPKKESSFKFNSKSPRFKYGNSKSPGPGQYHDPNQNLWNKKTYNIIFAEI